MSRVIQLMLVEAETAEEAANHVSGLLDNETPTPHWSDYHDLVDEFDGKSAVAYSETIGQIKLKEFLAYREADLKRYYDRVKNFDLAKAVENYDPFRAGHSFTEDDFRTYELRKLAGILEDSWTMDTGVYDLETWSANLKAFRERCQLAPEMQFLVAVSFHH
jgi:hypothetical protein